MQFCVMQSVPKYPTGREAYNNNLRAMGTLDRPIYESANRCIAVSVLCEYWIPDSGKTPVVFRIANLLSSD